MTAQQHFNPIIGFSKRRKNFMPLNNKKSDNLPSYSEYAHSGYSHSQALSASRPHNLSGKSRIIKPPGPKLRSSRIKSQILENNYPEIASLPQVSSSQTATPSWLIHLYTLYHCSYAITFLLAVIVLVIYGWTVHSQKLWGQSYRKIQKLQRDERQLMKTNEVLKNKMAQESEKPNIGLFSPTTNKTIFLPKELWEQKQTLDDNSKPTQTQNQPRAPFSLGY